MVEIFTKEREAVADSIRARQLGTLFEANERKRKIDHAFAQELQRQIDRGGGSETDNLEAADVLGKEHELLRDEEADRAVEKKASHGDPSLAHQSDLTAKTFLFRPRPSAITRTVHPETKEKEKKRSATFRPLLDVSGQLIPDTDSTHSGRSFSPIYDTKSRTADVSHLLRALSTSFRPGR